MRVVIASFFQPAGQLASKRGGFRKRLPPPPLSFVFVGGGLGSLRDDTKGFMQASREGRGGLLLPRHPRAPTLFGARTRAGAAGQRANRW
jgi:hypothetical protein